MIGDVDVIGLSIGLFFVLFWIVVFGIVFVNDIKDDIKKEKEFQSKLALLKPHTIWNRIGNKWHCEVIEIRPGDLVDNKFVVYTLYTDSNINIGTFIVPVDLFFNQFKFKK